jgi:DNA-binding NarL/FixJ family response regulator
MLTVANTERRLTMTSILIADEHGVVREGLRLHLDAQPNWKVVAEARDGEEAVLRALETKPDVAVLGYGLPPANGIETTRQIRTELPNTKVLIYTMRIDENLLRLLKEAGALGCVLKSEPMETLIQAVRSVAAHKPYFNGTVAGRNDPHEASPSLTGRQRTVVQLIAEGQSNKQIAGTLGISKKTVETHRSDVMRRLGFSSSAELVRYAVRNELVMA